MHRAQAIRSALHDRARAIAQGVPQVMAMVPQVSAKPGRAIPSRAHAEFLLDDFPRLLPMEPLTGA